MSSFRMPQRSSRSKRDSQLPGLKILIICIVLCFIAMTVYARESSTGPIHRVKGVVGTVTSPLSHAGSVIAQPFSGIGNVYRNATADEASLTSLEQENATLRGAVERLEEYKQESERLEKLLNIKSTYNLKSQAARVIGSTVDAWNRTIEINKGSNDGLAVNMPVLNSYGLIGQVIEVSATSAKVRLINDEMSALAAMIQSNRIEGILRGSADGSLKLDYIPLDATVTTGDVIITSGSGGVYPKGLPIGEVVNVEKDPSSLYYTITVRPPAGSLAYEEVLVITELNSPDKQPIAPAEKTHENALGTQASPSIQQGSQDSSEQAGQGGSGTSGAKSATEGASGSHGSTQGEG